MADLTIHELQNEATAPANDDYAVLDGATAGTRKITPANLATWILGKISSLATTVTSFASGDFIAVSNTTNGSRKMSKDTLLELTAQNALGSIKNLPTTITAFRTGDVIPVDGPSGTAKMLASDLQDAILGGPIDEAVQQWLDEHPEATTTVEDGSITDLKLNESIKFNVDSGSGFLGRRVIGKGADILNEMSNADTIYEIRWSFDLNGATLNVPNNCVLHFNGGRIDNGLIVGADTRIEYEGECFGRDVDFSGTWIVPVIKTSMLENCVEPNNLKKLIKLCSSNVVNEVFIEEGTYVFTPSANNETFVAPPSNTFIFNSGTLKITPNGFKNYQIVGFVSVKNCGLRGGKYVGDVDEHDYSSGGTHEWGHCVSILSSSHISVSNLEVSDAAGDGICVSDGNNYIDVAFVDIDHCGRQGITIGQSSFVNVHDFKINDIFRTNPMSGIDIEPNYGKATNVSISNGTISNARSALLLTLFDNVCVSDVKIDGCHRIISAGGGSSPNTNLVVKNIYVSNSIAESFVRNIDFGNVANALFDNIVSDSGTYDYFFKLMVPDISYNVVLSKIKLKSSSGNGGFFKNVIFRDCEFDLPILSSRYGTAGASTDVCEFYNCKFRTFGYMYGGKFYFENCQFVQNAGDTDTTVAVTYSTAMDQIKFKGCLFDFRVSLNTIMSLANSKIELERCTILGGGTAPIFVGSGASASIEFNDCTVDFSKFSNYLGTLSASYDVKIDGIDAKNYIEHDAEVCTSSNASKILSTALENKVRGEFDLNGQTVVLKQDGVLYLEGIVKNGTINLNGSKIIPSYDRLEVAGVTITGNPGVGTMRYTGTKYTYWDGSSWVNMDGSPV